jgi:hypothetical protein
MVFWVSILAGGFFAWLAVKIGFYESLALLFNIIISIYIAVFLTPVIIETFPSAGDVPYCYAMAMVFTSIGTFLVLFGITYVFLTGQFKVTFPKLFDILFSGLIGFLIGFLVLSFIALAITATPVSQYRLVQKIGLNRQAQQSNIAYISWWCDLVHSVTSTPDSITSEDTINQLLDSAQSSAPNKPEEDTQLSEPNKPDDSTSPSEGNEPDTPS